MLGSGTYTETIGSVNQIMFRHDDGTASSGGSFINGLVGIDNITAVPCPGLRLYWCAALLSGLGGGGGR